MSMFKSTRNTLGLGFATLMLLTAAPALGQDAGTGQEKKVVFEEQDGMAAVLKRLEGRPVRLRLAGSGEEVLGKLQKVGKELAHLSDLSGREFFDAVVRIDQVSAVSVQVRGR
ncbi:MAG: hypothetical protein IPP07_16845 [Holophagales bacterium]|nr:hypothetical protein [Holophagales bacterium]MBK9966462.1 hypothetical protein [Holophagales bacterium]